jgi:hypothetical protein
MDGERVVPYERFLECRQRRLQAAAELQRLEERRTIDSEVVSVASVTPAVPAPTSNEPGATIPRV